MPQNADPDEIEVLLATFNGGAHLQQQMDSVLAQAGVAVTILARDDGSRDETPEILRHAVANDPERVRVMPAGPPTGSPTGNFAALLRASSGPYAALCDQDDVWLPDKLQRSLEAMRRLEAAHGRAMPLLVFTDLSVVDADLRAVSPSLWRHNRIEPRNVHRLGRLLGENVVTGCTALLNRAMVELAARMPTGQVAGTAGSAVLMHDHWIALLACTLGRAAWVDAPLVRYRQHEGNVVGAARREVSAGGRVTRVLENAARVRRRAGRVALQAQAGAFLASYRESIQETDRATLEAFATLGQQSPWEQMRRMRRFGFWRATAARNAVSLLDSVRNPHRL